VNKRILLVIVLLYTICTCIYSQDEYSPEDIFVINSFAFNVNGITRPYALIRTAELYTGEEITGFSALEEYIQDKTQILLNERILEIVTIDYTVREVQENGTYPVDFVVNVKDTWNIIAIPRPQYSSNTGFEITIKARDYNFLGTMQSLRLDLGYRYDQHNRTFFNIMLDVDYPFRLFDLDWDFNFDHHFDYRPNLRLPLFYKNVTGLSVELPVKLTTLTIGINESFILNETNSESNMLLYPELSDIQDGLYMTSNPYVSWRIPTGVNIGSNWELVYTPRISATFYHEFPQWPLDITRKGPYMSFSHSLGFGRIDFLGNFQSGFEAGISNSFTYNFTELKDHNQLNSYLGITGKWHITFDNVFGISSRLMSRHWFLTQNGNGSAGDVLRGILVNDVFADYMLSLNLDISVKILEFRLSNLFPKTNWRVLNFDLHAVPFLDAAIYRSPYNEENFSGTDFSFKNMLVTCGMELIVFPVFFRSLFLRASLGLNLSTLTHKFKGLENGKEMGRYEIFIGTELHY